MPNRLSRETSPYLLQHQHNPVDWYPWGDEAFAAAKTQNKPIFLSVGYSTCYWCHVMERQCFKVEAIAAVMNRLFINIKVDREERPDVDQLYMTAVQLLTRQGGWPMSVFLLPDRQPFYGGTYFPPTDGHGRPGFPRLLEGLHDAFVNRRADVDQTAGELTHAITQISDPSQQKIGKSPKRIDAAMVQRLIDHSTADYEPTFGGFGQAPKFPRETLLQSLLLHHRQTRDTKLAAMIRHTLDAMANGGIRDHLGGGFHRYSTDARWLVPHFEIMLYDNAMLAWIYADASEQFAEARYGRIARAICDFVLSDMTDPAGPFYTAIDAEVNGQEGLNYLWTEAEINAVLGPLATRFNELYGVSDGPNFADPHHGNGVPETNILFLPNGPAGEDDPAIVAARQALLGVRRQRQQPLLDTKILTSWNALMIRGLAHAGHVLNEPRYRFAAERAADWLMKNHRTGDGTLMRTSRDGGPAKYAGFLDDYAFLAQAMFALGRNDIARQIEQSTRDRFLDPESGSYFFTDRHGDELFARQKVTTDSPLPSGNGVMAEVLIDLGDFTSAGRLLGPFAGSLARDSGGMSAMVAALQKYVATAGELRTDGVPESDVETPVVQFHVEWADDRSATLTLTIADGFHLNAPDATDGLQPTVVTATPAATVEYPMVSAPIIGRAEIRIRWPAPIRDVSRLHVRYQPCSESACLAVQTHVIELPARS